MDDPGPDVVPAPAPQEAEALPAPANWIHNEVGGTFGRSISAGVFGKPVDDAGPGGGVFTRQRTEDFFRGPSLTPRGTEEEIAVQNVASELLDSELAYLHDLELMREIFMDPLRQEELLTREELLSIFRNIELLLDLAKDLSSALQKMISAHGIADASVGYIFLGFKRDFARFVDFCCTERSAMAVLANLKKKRPDFAKWLADACKVPAVEIKSWGLEDFLSLPLKRVYCYPKFLERLVVHSPESGDDMMLLCEAHARVSSCLMAINESWNLQQNQDRLVSLDKVFDKGNEKGFGLLAAPMRNLLREGTLIKTNVHGRKQERYCFLFHDALAYTVAREAKGKARGKQKLAMCYDLRGVLYFRNIQLRSKPKRSSSRLQEKYTFEITRTDRGKKGKTYKFSHPSQVDGYQWACDIESCIGLAKDSRQRDLGLIHFDRSLCPAPEMSGGGEMNLLRTRLMEGPLAQTISSCVSRWVVRFGSMLFHAEMGDLCEVELICFDDGIAVVSHFSDSAEPTESKVAVGRLRARHFVPFDSCLINDLLPMENEDRKEENLVSFEIINISELDEVKHVLKFRANNARHKNSWLLTLNETLTCHLMDRTRPIMRAIAQSRRKRTGPSFKAAHLSVVGRKLVKEGQVVETNEYEVRQRRTLLLFTDALMISREYLFLRNEMQLLEVFEKQELIVHGARANDRSFSLVRMDSGVLLSFEANSVKECELWVSSLSDVAKGIRPTRQAKYVDRVVQDARTGTISLSIVKEGEGTGATEEQEEDDTGVLVDEVESQEEDDQELLRRAPESLADQVPLPVPSDSDSAGGDSGESDDDDDFSEDIAAPVEQAEDHCVVAEGPPEQEEVPDPPSASVPPAVDPTPVEPGSPSAGGGSNAGSPAPGFDFLFAPPSTIQSDELRKLAKPEAEELGSADASGSLDSPNLIEQDDDDATDENIFLEPATLEKTFSVVRSYANSTKPYTIEEIRSWFPNQDTHLLPNSRFHFYSRLQKENERGTKQDRHVFLFTERLLYCRLNSRKKKDDNDTFSIRGNLLLSTLTIRDYWEDQSGRSFCVTVDHGKRAREIPFFCKDVEEKEHWMAEFRNPGLIRTRSAKHR